MSFSRQTPALLKASELDAAMRSIGMRVGHASRHGEAADIEVTLASVAATAMGRDYRLLGVLVAWLEVHHARVNVPRLRRILSQQTPEELTRAFWAAVGGWLGRADARWAALSRLYRGAPLDLDDPEVTALQLARVGPDTRFEDTPLRVHAKLLRSRRQDVDDPVQVASRHPTYLRRVQLGANYRADVWAALDAVPDASAAQIARQVGCAYETARSVAEDFRTAHLAEVSATAL